MAIGKFDKWDLRFLDMAKLVSSWSKDPSTKLGAVITRNRQVISVGFNGFPQYMQDDPALYADRETKYSRIVHAETNALIFAKQDLTSASIYTWPFLSCDRCIVQLIQAGIILFVAPRLPADKVERWGTAIEKSKAYAKEAGCVVVEIDYDS